LRRKAARNAVNFLGWNTNRRIIVIESDDWGSIRMPSKNVYNKFLSKGIPVDQSPYCRYDSLASEDDLKDLFDVLTSVKDSNNNNPAFTANTVVTNPDFLKIKESGYSEYHYELFTDTLKKYPNHSKCFNLWKKGIDEGIFYPQFHGREHLNVPLWLELLQSEHPDFLFAFENNCWGLSTDIYPRLRMSIQASLDIRNQSNLAFQKKSIIKGCELFENIFGYRSRSFIANNFIWSSSLNATLLKAGVKYLQGMKYQKMPLNGNKKRKMVRHYLGEQNKLGQYYLVRNCSFEPSQREAKFDNVGECMKDISNAFFWNKPAIISSHRLNYIGYLDANNKNQNLILLEKLLNKIVSTWPEVEFLTSNQLGDIIEK